MSENETFLRRLVKLREDKFKTVKLKEAYYELLSQLISDHRISLQTSDRAEENVTYKNSLLIDKQILSQKKVYPSDINNETLVFWDTLLRFGLLEVITDMEKNFLYYRIKSAGILTIENLYFDGIIFFKTEEEETRES